MNASCVFVFGVFVICGWHEDLVVERAFTSDFKRTCKRMGIKDTGCHAVIKFPASG